MTRMALLLITAYISACSTLAPEERTATIPNIPVEKKDCESPLGTIPDGGSAAGFLNEYEPAGRSCQPGELTCHDGLWSGAYVHTKCTPGAGVAP